MYPFESLNPTGWLSLFPLRGLSRLGLREVGEVGHGVSHVMYMQVQQNLLHSVSYR